MHFVLSPGPGRRSLGPGAEGEEAELRPLDDWPSPANRAILTVLKAGESVFQILL